MKPFVFVAGALLVTSFSAPSWAQTTAPDQTQNPAGNPPVNTPLGDAPGPSNGPATDGTLGAVGGSTTGLIPVPDYPSAGLADVRERQADDQPVLTLGDAVLTALRNNPTPQAARAAVEGARARAGQAAAAGKFQLNLQGTENNQRAIIGAGSTGTGTGTGTTVSTSNGLTGFLGGTSAEQLALSATLPIYSGGRVRNSRRAAEAAARAQLLRSQQTEQELAAQAILAYVSVLQNQELLQVANSNLDTSRERRRVAGVRYDAGAAARLEVLRADSDLASAAQRRIASANGVAQAKAALNILLARAPETPVRVEPIQTLVLPAVARFPLAEQATAIANGGDIPTSPDLRAIADSALPSLNASRETIASSEYSVAAQKAQKKPNIGASLIGLLRNPVGTVGRFLLNGGLSVAQVLIDGNRINSQVDEARATLEQARQSLAGQELQTANAIEGSLLSLDSALKRQTSAQTSVLSAQEALRAAQLAYTAGAGTQLDVIDAQNALLTAQTDAVNARYQVAQAQVQLAAATAIVGSGSATGNTGLGSSAGTGQTATTSASGANQNTGSVGFNNGLNTGGLGGVGTIGNIGGIGNNGGIGTGGLNNGGIGTGGLGTGTGTGF